MQRNIMTILVTLMTYEYLGWYGIRNQKANAT
jgi:hypothetical protein